MTERSWFIARITGALLAAILFAIISTIVLTRIVPFELDQFETVISSSLIPVGDYVTAGVNAVRELWAYRGIDALLVGIVLVVAAIGAATLFRLEKGREDEAQED
jgi:multisubunit Na+/H+ antiporter MnhB subunit